MLINCFWFWIMGQKGEFLPDMQTNRRWMRSLLLWKRDRILFLAATLASWMASWISCCSRSSEVPELGVRLLTGLEGKRANCLHFIFPSCSFKDSINILIMGLKGKHKNIFSHLKYTHIWLTAYSQRQEFVCMEQISRRPLLSLNTLHLLHHMSN